MMQNINENSGNHGEVNNSANLIKISSSLKISLTGITEFIKSLKSIEISIDNSVENLEEIELTIKNIRIVLREFKNDFILTNEVNSLINDIENKSKLYQKIKLINIMIDDIISGDINNNISNEIDSFKQDYNEKYLELLNIESFDNYTIIQGLLETYKRLNDHFNNNLPESIKVALYEFESFLKDAKEKGLKVPKEIDFEIVNLIREDINENTIINSPYEFVLYNETGDFHEQSDKIWEELTGYFGKKDISGYDEYLDTIQDNESHFPILSKLFDTPELLKNLYSFKINTEGKTVIIVDNNELLIEVKLAKWKNEVPKISIKHMIKTIKQNNNIT